MKLQQQVTSPELSKKLKELGVKQDSLFYWGRKNPEIFARTGIDDTIFGFTTLNAEGPKGDPYWFDKGELSDSDESWYSSFTVAELGEMLPWRIEYKNRFYVLECKKGGNPWYWVDYQYSNSGLLDFDCFTQEAETEADARAKMLIYLIENNHITL